MSQPKLK